MRPCGLASGSVGQSVWAGQSVGGSVSQSVGEEARGEEACLDDAGGVMTVKGTCVRIGHSKGQSTLQLCQWVGQSVR